MDQDWILQKKETRRTYSSSTWIPLRASTENVKGDVKKIGYISDYFGCGSVAFPLEHRKVAEQLDYDDIGFSHSIHPYAYEDGYYSSIEQYQRNDKEPIGVNLVFEHPQPVVGGSRWILNPDLVVALKLIKEGNNWVRPEENFIIVAREELDEKGDHVLIEIKREFLLDYLAARNLFLRLSYFHQRVENIAALIGSPYENLKDYKEERNGGDFELRIRSLKDIYGRSWASFRVWRNDIDEDEDAPIMGPESNNNTSFESSRGYGSGYDGIRIESEFFRNEWIEHNGQSMRVRRDADHNLPQFIVETDGTRMPSALLDDEDVGRWLWFRSGVINELLSLRGFSLKWYTAETGAICSTSGHQTHFGINSSDLITVYAYDIARLNGWEQHVWGAHNTVPDGKVSKELLASQVKVNPASTYAVEELLFKVVELLEVEFRREFNISLYTHNIEYVELMSHISRFVSKDQASLLRLAKELVRIFTDRLNIRELRKLSTHANKEKLGSNKLLEDILAQKIGSEKAREIFAPIVGTYEMRVGDAHPTSSNIEDALKLVGIDRSNSFLRQGEELISNFGKSVFLIGKILFEKTGESSE